MSAPAIARRAAGCRRRSSRNRVDLTRGESSLNGATSSQPSQPSLFPRPDDATVVGPAAVQHGMTLALRRDEAHGARPTRRRAREDDMPQQTLAGRVDSLESRMNELGTVPGRLDRLESQILQLRAEMIDGFAAAREDTATGLREVRGEMAAEFKVVRGEMAAGFAAVRGETAAEFKAVRHEIREGDEETRRYMRVLHEEVIARIAAISEGRRSRRKE
jgi:hypothetical protein